MTNGRRQGIFWILTLPVHTFTPFLSPSLRWIKGQLEEGAGGFRHWQVVCAFQKKQALRGVTDLFGPYHAELSRSSAASEYVWKDDSCVDAGFRFELGVRPIERNSKRDWESVWTQAQNGDLEAIPADIRVVSYRTLRAIGADYAMPKRMDRVATVFWGPTGTGKSYTAWLGAGDDGYSKDPRSKFWSGYTNQTHVVIDEFRGGIDIAHMLRWLDPYPVHVEIKGASRPLCATNYFITSNLDPKDWYPELDYLTVQALLRRLNVVYMDVPYLK